MFCTWWVGGSPVCLALFLCAQREQLRHVEYVFFAPGESLVSGFGPPFVGISQSEEFSCGEQTIDFQGITFIFDSQRGRCLQQANWSCFRVLLMTSMFVIAVGVTVIYGRVALGALIVVCDLNVCSVGLLCCRGRSYIGGVGVACVRGSISCSRSSSFICIAVLQQ